MKNRNSKGVFSSEPETRLSVQERFERYIYYSIDGCHYWLGGLSKYGYGKFTINKKSVVASRAAYQIYIGPIPNGLLACHRCDNPGCVNPDHLFIGTHQENLNDMSIKGRHLMDKCKNGHPLTSDNLYINIDRMRNKTNRRCKTCAKNRAVEWTRAMRIRIKNH